MRKNCDLFKSTIIILLIPFLVLGPLTYGRVAVAEGTIPDEIYFLIQMGDFLKTNYVEDVEDIELLRGAVKGMVEALDDPYSEYYTPEEFKEFNETTSGNFGELGW